jgi:psiF repeat
MKRLLWSAAAGALLVLASVSPGVQAAENSQQARMTSCNADAKAKNLSGDDRKAFMKSCLSASGGSAAKGNSQQEKMKTCNADAKTRNLKGDDRKKFMSDCLKGS